MMKKVSVFLRTAMVFVLVFVLTSCSAAYKKGVKFDDYPEKDVPIYDEAIVFSYEVKGDKCTIKYGSEDDVDDIMEFYIKEFEDEDYRIIDEDIDDDEYSVEGIIDDIAFEIDVEEARGDKEEKYFDTVVEVEVTFDSNDYDEDELDSSKEESSKTNEESLDNAEENSSFSETDEQSAESDEIVKVKAISDILDGQTHTSKEGLITVEFGTIEVESGSNNYLHMECPLTITNNSDETIYIAVENTWTNGLSLGYSDNFELGKGESGVLYADLGASSFEAASISEIQNLLFYVQVKDTYDYNLIDTAVVNIANPDSSYIQQDVSCCSVIMETDEVKVSYGGNYSNDIFDCLVFYVKNNDHTFNINNEYSVSLNELILNDIEIPDSHYLTSTYGHAYSMFVCYFMKEDYSTLFEGDSIMLNSAWIKVTNINGKHTYDYVIDLELELNGLIGKPGTGSTSMDVEYEEESIIEDAIALIDDYGKDRFVEKLWLCSAAGEYSTLTDYEENVLYMASLMAGASAMGDPCEILLENGHITQKRADAVLVLYEAWKESLD